jgi:hypothetical protein
VHIPSKESRSRSGLAHEMHWLVIFDTLHEVPGELNEKSTVHLFPPILQEQRSNPSMRSMIMDAIKEASHYKSGSQTEKLMNAIQHHPKPTIQKGSSTTPTLPHHLTEWTTCVHVGDTLPARQRWAQIGRRWTIQAIRSSTTGNMEGNGAAKIKNEKNGEWRSRKTI